MKPYDRHRTVIATFGDNKYTTKDVSDAIGCDLNTAQCLRDLSKNKEIERVDDPEGKSGRHTVWRTVELREVRQPRETKANSDDEGFPWEYNTPDTVAAQRLCAALDAMTRRHQQGAAR